ncbi:unnamed protein product [Leptosia nina]|uniref:C2H2-type domain-containing protein n=1 Tax=Leptosia nina TaxID=320188 RepID=A0AAV1JDL2_9NEOP
MQDHNNCKNISNKLLDIHGEGSQRSIFETLNSRNSSLDSSNHDFQSKSVNPDLTDILLDEIEMLLEDDSFNCDTVSKLLKKHNASHKLQANKKPQASKRTNLIENHFNGDSSKCSNSPGKRIYVNPDTVLDEIDCMINSRYLDENDDQDSFDNSKPDTVVNNEEQNYSEVFDSIDKLICDNNTASVILRKYQHNKFMKQRQKKRKCRICGKQLANPSSYRVHMNLHAKKNRFICEQCGNTYTTLVGLQCHKLTKHGTGPYIQCSQCSFKASRRFDMIEHERIHTGERPFTCDKCGLTFRRRYIYKNHLIKHTEKKVQCSQCPKKFFRREDMLAHCNSNHKRCYMFKCSECDTLYAKISTVRRHLIDKHGVPREIQPKLVRVMMADIV